MATLIFPNLIIFKIDNNSRNKIKIIKFLRSTQHFYILNTKEWKEREENSLNHYKNTHNFT